MDNMNKFYICIFLMPIVVYTIKHQCRHPEKPLSLIILYESLCTDSQNYLLKFWPVYQEFHNCINLTLIPFGKVRRSCNQRLVCQHGMPECWGNRLQVCALHTNLTALQKMEFVACQMSDFELTLKMDFQCARSLNIENEVRTCLNTTGKEYGGESEQMTRRYLYGDLPAIIFNEKIDEYFMRVARRSVRPTICHKLIENQQLLRGEC